MREPEGPAQQFELTVDGRVALGSALLDIRLQVLRLERDRAPRSKSGSQGLDVTEDSTE